MGSSGRHRAAVRYGTPTRWPQVRFDRSGDDTCGHDNDN
jgi:hypothetical protein